MGSKWNNTCILYIKYAINVRVFFYDFYIRFIFVEWCVRDLA